MALEGGRVLLLVQTSSGTFSVAGEQTDLRTESTTNLIDASVKNDKHQRWLPGKKGDTLELSSLYAPNDLSFGQLWNARNNGVEVVVRRAVTLNDGTVVVFESSGFVSNISTASPDGDLATATVTINLNRDWEVIEAIEDEDSDEGSDEDSDEGSDEG